MKPDDALRLIRASAFPVSRPEFRDALDRHEAIKRLDTIYALACRALGDNDQPLTDQELWCEMQEGD